MQNYSNHRQYYTAHHFVFYPVIIAAAVFCFIFGATHHCRLLWIVTGVLFLVIGWLSFMLRQHYALGLQNRLILLEMKIRYMEAGVNFGEIQKELSKGQLFALRFAPDEELKELTERAIREKLSSTAIKKSIKNWKGDYLRV